MVIDHGVQLLEDPVLLEMIKGEGVERFTLIDIREPDEFRREHIPGSINIPLSEIPNRRNPGAQGRPVIFYCKSGVRSQQGIAQLDRWCDGHKYCLKGGLEQWKNCGLPTRKDSKAPLELMRQVQLLLGVLLVISALAGYLVSSHFLAVSLVIGCGLLVAGATGFCGMARLLALLPYNRNRI